MFIGNYFYYEIPTSLMELTTTSVYFVVFVLLTFILSRIFRNVLRPFVLLVASLFFLYSFGKQHIYIVLAVSLLSYIFGILLSKFKKIWLLIISLIPFVGVLAYFKYVPMESFVMPLGISFYSFKVISYLVDIYKGKVQVEYNPIYYFDYVLFFPCITAGPIHRYEHFREEIRDHSPFNYKEAKGGAFQMMLGIYEKRVFCDFIASVVSRCLDNPEVIGKGALLGVLLYSLQIYLDFDAISNIAIGCARLLGFDVKKNFNSPYLARTLKEFWNRWHISLSTWLRDYIYIPLGGNRKGELRRYLNLIIVFAISGLWHGNTWNFLIWGLVHAFVQIIEDLIKKLFDALDLSGTIMDYAEAPLSLIGIVINFFIVSFTWLIFKYQSFAEIKDILLRISLNGAIDFELIGMTGNEVKWLMFIVVAMVILDILRNHTNMIETFNNLVFPVRWIVYVLLIVSFFIFGVYGGSFEASDFIYRWF